jgi:hypothetical protein
MNQHILFDVKPDDTLTEEQKAAYKRVFTIADAEKASSDKFDDLSYFDAPPTVRIAGNRPSEGDEIDIHFVNYNRDESKDPPRGGGVENEHPIAVPEVKCDVVIPAGFRE